MIPFAFRTFLVVELFGKLLIITTFFLGFFGSAAVILSFKRLLSIREGKTGPIFTRDESQELTLAKCLTYSGR